MSAIEKLRNELFGYPIIVQALLDDAHILVCEETGQVTISAPRHISKAMLQEYGTDHFVERVLEHPILGNDCNPLLDTHVPIDELENLSAIGRVRETLDYYEQCSNAG